MARALQVARYLVEGAAAWVLFGAFALLPLDWASGLGGAVARGIGPRLGISKRAVRNLERAMPELGADDIRGIVRGMWDNLGRVVAEYPHLGRLRVLANESQVAVEGLKAFLAARETSRPCLLFSAHYGNWELLRIAAAEAGLQMTAIYRSPNNPLIDRLLRRARGGRAAALVPKGRAAARASVAALEEGHDLCLLVDQKANDGVPVPFFGRDAMTAPALARLALRYRCPVVPARVERQSGARFRLVVEPPLPLPATGDVHADTLALMTAVNATIERWIRARPEQWFWLHRRWPD